MCNKRDPVILDEDMNTRIGNMSNVRLLGPNGEGAISYNGRFMRDFVCLKHVYISIHGQKEDLISS